jgi:hypothetical protein
MHEEGDTNVLLEGMGHATSPKEGREDKVVKEHISSFFQFIF